MAQDTIPTITPETTTGTDLANELNGYVDSVNSQHSGVSRPAYAVAGMIWSHIPAAGDEHIYFFDGANDILVGTLTASSFIPGTGGPAVDVTYDNTTSGATATDVQAAIDEVIEHIITLNSNTTANALLDSIKTVDGAGSGLDADLIRGVAPVTIDKIINPNLLYNGNLRLNTRQFGTMTASNYSVDRTYVTISGSADVIQDADDAKGLLGTITAASSFVQYLQPLPKEDVIALRGKELTLTVNGEVNASFDGNQSIQILYSNTSDARVGQSTYASLNITPVVNVAYTHSLTFTVPADAVGLSAALLPSLVQGNVGSAMALYNWKLEEGSVFTGFTSAEAHASGLTCREFVRMFGAGQDASTGTPVCNGFAVTTGTARYHLTVNMRKLPTMTVPDITQWRHSDGITGTAVAFSMGISIGLSDKNLITISAESVTATLVAHRPYRLEAATSANAKIVLEAEL